MLNIFIYSIFSLTFTITESFIKSFAIFKVDSVIVAENNINCLSLRVVFITSFTTFKLFLSKSLSPSSITIVLTVWAVIFFSL